MKKFKLTRVAEIEASSKKDAEKQLRETENEMDIFISFDETLEEVKPTMDIKLYYHKTSGGAEYLSNTFIKWSHNGKSGKEGTMTDKTKYLIRIDGDITKDAKMSVR